MCDPERGMVSRCGESVLSKSHCKAPNQPSYNFDAMKDTMRKAWRVSKEMRIVLVGSNIFQFIFSDEDLYRFVLSEGPWTFDNNLFVFKVWEPGLIVKEISFYSIDFWIQIWSLPMEFIKVEVGQAIGQGIGSLLEIDERAIALDQGRFIRTKVRIPLERPLMRGASVNCGSRGNIWVDFRYERLSSLCFYCGILGHDERNCPRKDFDT
ncbi:hypothetical protein Dimus_038623 [Dionaea muscipula]